MMQNSALVLVTGGTGAIGIHCIQALLNKGYHVRTTLRSLNRQQDIKAMLTGPLEKLSFVAADLTADANWDAAVKDCRYVLHVASPTHIESTKESTLTGPAVDGVLRVLKAARDAGVKRMVLTSSFGALGFSNKDRNTETTEANWTDPNEKGLSAYEKSKTLAERAAWDFIKSEGNGLELAVINPVAVFGPSLGPNKSPSLRLLKSLLNADMKAIPNIPLNAVDIRDVADLHIRAMEIPAAAGQRFIATADGEISLPEIARLLRTKMPAISAKVPKRTMPAWLLRLAALFNPQAKHALSLMQINRRVSNAKARKILGWTPVANNEEAILAAVESMIKFSMTT